MEEFIKNIQGQIELTLLDIEQLKFNAKVVQNQLQEASNKLDRLYKHLDIVTKADTISIKLEDYFTPEELAEYNPQYDFLFEPNMNIKDWLDWFFEEIPFIKDKHLTFTGLVSKQSYSISDLYGIVKTDNNKQQVYIEMDEPVLITLNNINLFRILQTS